MNRAEIQELLLGDLTDDQKKAVRAPDRRLLVVAGAGSGKTEVMARRIAWWVGVEAVPKNRIVAFTFTERAAEEMKVRIRSWIEKITPPGEEVALGEMYVGTIHGFCLAKIREFWPDDYHNYDILDEASRAALILRGFTNLLGLRALQSNLELGQYATLDAFTLAYDQLHEHDQFRVELPDEQPPIELGETEQEWCKKAKLLTPVGESEAAQSFARSAARYYAYLRCRRFLDFSTSQTEFIRRLKSDKPKLAELKKLGVYLVVDEVQDINRVQLELIKILSTEAGKLTAVGDHRQAIYGFRGAKVEIIAELWEEFKTAEDGRVIDLKENFRSTPRIIDIANRWTENISPLLSMQTRPMKHGNATRVDTHSSHVALVSFEARAQEAEWIAKAILALVPSDKHGAKHDKKGGAKRGLALSDIAVLVRSSTDVRTYMRALEAAGISPVVRAGPDLFSQPEVLFLLGALALTAGTEEFFGNEHNPKSLPNRIKSVLGCEPKARIVMREAAKQLRHAGLKLEEAVETRLVAACDALHNRIAKSQSVSAKDAAPFRTPALRQYLTRRGEVQRVFPQQLYHFLLSEAETENWDTCADRGQAAMFHLGALSGLITGIEMPGWTSAKNYPWELIGLCQYGAEEGRTEEQPLMVQPDAVTISTVHGVKGLEFAAIFLADVNALRFPSSRARIAPKLPFDGAITKKIDIGSLADNDNHDSERRLMYVALTRAERFLVISHSGSKTSKFVKELRELVKGAGGSVTDDAKKLLHELEYAPIEHKRDLNFSTSFSDLRYFLECPHDFYLRKVMGFAPTIDQAFGYGRGVHNLLRAVHSDPKKWAELAKDEKKLIAQLQELVRRGLFYLRYTAQEPAQNMRDKGQRVVADYVRYYCDELAKLTFEPEKEFETLVEFGDGEGGALISGAIDIVRQDDPPRVTLIDFKSGDPDSDKHKQLTEDEMRLQVATYAIAAKKELEYQPGQGLVRYLDINEKNKEKRELQVPLDDKTTTEAEALLIRVARQIRARSFKSGPEKRADGRHRCHKCDFVGHCGMPDAISHKRAHPNDW